MTHFKILQFAKGLILFWLQAPDHLRAAVASDIDLLPNIATHFLKRAVRQAVGALAQVSITAKIAGIYVEHNVIAERALHPRSGSNEQLRSYLLIGNPISD